MNARTFPYALAALAALVGCGETPTPDSETLVVGEGDFVKVLDDRGDASAEAIFLDFEFDGELVTNTTYGAEAQIREQMLYTIGHLNGDNSVGDLNRLELTNVRTERVAEGTRVSYSAKLLVAWGDKANPVSSYEFVLPRNVSFSGLEAFTEKYSHSCVDFGAHDVDAGSMWYYYRPKSSRCALDEADLVRLPVRASVSSVNTSGKYPEYHKVWEDGALKVVAVFGKYEDGATTASDAGIAAYNRFVSSVRNELRPLGSVTTEPATIPNAPGIGTPDISIRADLGDGESVEVVALLVDNVRTAGATFDRRYAELTPRADLIVYNGHAGLGANIRALARKGDWEPGQYSVVFMNGCDTYAYVDSALADARAAINPDDPVGTKYVDVVTNAMPSFFSSMSNATLALIRGLLSKDEPRTYEQIFTNIDQSEVVIVSGEQDNEYVPGGGGEPVDRWAGMTETGTVRAGEEHRFETPVLPAGEYTFVLSGDNDADLYVRLGEEPTTTVYDCRPFRAGSAERCVVELPAATAVHVMVRGWDPSSNYKIEGN